jgi:putative copper resistance protein D
MYQLRFGCFLLLTLVLLVWSAGFAQQHGSPHEPSSHQHGAPTAAGQWDGSPEGKAYSEFNHHLAGVFVLLIGVSELRGALGVSLLAWSRFLLPLAMLGAGGFLMIWSDHEAWPIGYKSFAETYFSDDWETVQHKLYAILLLGVGSVELLRRKGKIGHMAWGMPLPLFALIGGVLLFLHSHGTHPSAHKIAIHHAVMGTTAVLAGTCKITAGTKLQEGRSPWGLAWAALVLLIGVELLLYTE